MPEANASARSEASASARSEASASARSEASASAIPEAAWSGANALFDGIDGSWALPPATELPRRVGARARRAALRAKAQRLEQQGDAAGAAMAYGELARHCWDGGFDYGGAIRVARRSIELKRDDAFSAELATRLERIGAHLASAELLEAQLANAAPKEAGALRRRLAALCHRAGDAETACVHFTEVARLDPEDTEALTAIGTLAGWAPDQVSRERGVVAWHEAARRYKQRGALLSAFESIHRAFELDPSSSLAAERLAQELDLLGRRDAADEIWRQSATAAGDAARHDIRALAALDAGDSVGALAAMLDGCADANFNRSELLLGIDHLLSPHQGLSRSFDEILAELGCADWLAVRLEAGPLLERWTDEAPCHVALGRIEAAYFAQNDAAREALVRAIVMQPAESEARARLSSWKQQGDEGPNALLRALVQAARSAQEGLLARQLATEIAEHYEQEPNAEALRLWALERLKQTGNLSEPQRTEIPRLVERVAARSTELRRLESSWSTLTIGERRDALKALERHLAVDPLRTIDHLAIAVALVELDPNDTVAQSLYVELLDVAARLVISPARDDRLAAALALAPQLLGERGYIAQAKFYLRHGQIELALVSVQQILESKSPSLRGLLWLFTLARRFRDARLAARALERASSGFRPAIRGILEALAAELYLDAQAPEETLRLVSSALRTNQNTPRLVALEIRLTEYFEPRSGIESIERALSRILPNAALYRALSKAHQKVGECDVALAWSQRALSLRPGDMVLRNEQLQLALEVGEPARVVDILQELMVKAVPISAWVEMAASALAWLSSVDAPRALGMAKRLLDHIGGTDRSLRAALLDVARANDDEGFAIEVLERAAAVSPDSPSIHLVLAERRWNRREVDAALVAALSAASACAEPSAWMAYVWASTEDAPADATLARLELARLLWQRQGRHTELAEVLRELAVLKFDLAHDTEGAVASWRELLEVSDNNWGRVCRDMGEVLGQRVAAHRLRELAKVVKFEARARLLGMAAQLSYEAGDSPMAEQLLELAVVTDSESLRLLPLAERVAKDGNSPERLDLVFGQLEQGLFGVYAERRLHYRAARAFERMSNWPLSLRHALQAFEALPEDEASWATLVRVSHAAAQPQTLAAAAMRAAEAARDRLNAHRWLERAFLELKDSPDELRLKFDLAIRMLVGAPGPRGVWLVADCLRQLERAGIEEADFMKMRFVRAIESLVGELEGPDGARLGIAAARVSIAELGRFDMAAQSLLGALKADGDLEEYAELVSVLATSALAAMAEFDVLLGRALDWLERPFVHAGEEALRLLVRLAIVKHDAGALGRILSVVQRAGRGAAFRTWMSGELLESLHGASPLELGHVCEGAAVLAFAWTEFGEPEFAMGLLGRTIELLAAVSVPGTLEGAREWQTFGERYLRTMEKLSSREHVSAIRQHLVRLERIAPPALVATLRVALERRNDDARALCAALAEQAFVGQDGPTTRVALLVEAAQLAEKLGDVDGAIVYYRAALSAQRSSAVARLGLGRLMVKTGRHRQREQAQLLLDVTNGLETVVAEEQREVAVFVQAQALMLLGRDDDARGILEAAQSQVGPRALIVLGLAELAMKHRQPTLALGYFAAALGGNLHQLRDLSEVALEAAQAAASVGEVTMALQWLEPSLDDPTTRPLALVLRAELEGVADAVGSAGTEPPAVVEGSNAANGARDEMEDDTSETRRGVSDVSSSTPELLESVGAMLLVTSGKGASDETFDENEHRETAPSGVTPIEPGAVEAAVSAAERIAAEPEQLRAWLPDGKRWLRQWPLSIRLVELVQRAARLEVHSSHAAALEQLIGVLRGDPKIARSSDLGEQPVDVDAVRSLLTRDLSTPESEALALVWDGAEHEFLREASDYDVTGVMRVVGTASPLARTYAEVGRHLGIPKTPMFHKRSPQAMNTRVLLLNPTAALVEGDLSMDEGLFAYRIGAIMWATIPEHSLLFAMDRTRVSSVLRALVLAFGSNVGQPNPTQGESLRLAQVLWQTVRSRSQRRLKQICESELDVGRAFGAASQSLRRAGLYVSADLRVSLRVAASELNLDAELVQSSQWTEVCRAAPDLLDLFRFAASGEYADIRWQLGRPALVGAGSRGS